MASPPNRRGTVVERTAGYTVLELTLAVGLIAITITAAINLWRSASDTSRVNQSIATISLAQDAVQAWQMDHPRQQPPNNFVAYTSSIGDPSRMVNGEGRRHRLAPSPTGVGLILNTEVESQTHARDLALYFRGSVSPVPLTNRWNVSIGLVTPLSESSMFEHTLLVDRDATSEMNRPIEFNDSYFSTAVVVDEPCVGYALAVDHVGRILACIEDEETGDEDSDSDVPDNGDIGSEEADEVPPRIWKLIECTRLCSGRRVPNSACDTCICNLNGDKCPGGFERDDASCACVCKRECGAGEIPAEDCESCVAIEPST